jgi:nucleoside-diphosphate-sugar epimerase
MKKAVVLGAGGFIGGHLVTRLIKDGYYKLYQTLLPTMV